MESNRIKRLTNSYFEGTTTREEEMELAHYLASSDNLPAELAPVKTMFEAMGLLKEVKAPQPKPHRRTITLSLFRRVAVAVVCIFAGLFITMRTVTTTTLHAEPMIICYVDGARVNDQQMAEEEMRRILGNMNQNVNLAMASIDKINIPKTDSL